MIASLDVNKTADWCNSFVLVSKPRLSIDPARLNKALIMHVPGGITVHDIFLELAGAMYLSIIDAKLGYRNLKLYTKITLFKNNLMAVWQIQISQATFLIVLLRRHVPKKN